MPFPCRNVAAVCVSKNDPSMIIAYKRNYCFFHIYTHNISSKVEKLIWVAFYKNENNNKCLIKKLPKELIIDILRLLGKQLIQNPHIKIDI